MRGYSFREEGNRYTFLLPEGCPAIFHACLYISPLKCSRSFSRNVAKKKIMNGLIRLMLIERQTRFSGYRNEEKTRDSGKEITGTSGSACWH